MGNRLVLVITLAVAFVLFAGADSVIDHNTDYFVYNPFIILPIFGALFALAITAEFAIINNLAIDTDRVGLLFGASIFLLAVGATLAYIVIAKAHGLGPFQSYAEQGNFFYSLVQRMALIALLVSTALSVGYALRTAKNKGHVGRTVIPSLLLFPLNYVLALVLVYVANIVSMIIGFGMDG